MAGHQTTDVRVERDLVIDLRDPVEPSRADVATVPAPDRARQRALVLLVTLNVLNLTDAVLTYAVTGAGIAREGNPFVTWLTLPGKTIFVAALSLLLWKLRPSALLIPVIGYAAVVTYTIAGALIFG